MRQDYHDSPPIDGSPRGDDEPRIGLSDTAGRFSAQGGGGLVLSQQQVRREASVDLAVARVRKMQAGVKLSARLAQEVTLAAVRARRAAMVTLTYRPGLEWSPGHVSAFLECLTKWARRRGFTVPYVWVAELQQRGAVHYHMVCWLPRGLTMPKPDKQGWWPYGSTRVEWASRAVGYITKYASKGDGLRAFPRGLRLWGAGGLCLRARELRTWLRLPTWLRREIDQMQRVARLPGGWFVATETGEMHRSPWEFVRLVTVRGVGVSVIFRERSNEAAA